MSKIESQRRLAERSFDPRRQLGEGVRTQLESVTETSATINESTASLREIADSVDTLGVVVEAKERRGFELEAFCKWWPHRTRERVRRGEHHQLSSSGCQATTTSIEEMTYSIKEVAKNIEALSTTAEETASSMSEMDVSISQVESNATETTKLSEQVMSDAEKGVQSINRTITGIDKIKEFSRTAAQVINNLGDKIQEIGNILNVIDDVAEQTNLLPRVERGDHRGAGG